MHVIMFAAGLALAAGAAQETSPAPSALELEGTLVPAEAAPISLWLERYRDELLVLEAAPHGGFVNEGDVILRLDTSRIDERIVQAEFDLELARRKLERTEAEARVSEEALEAQLVRAEKESEWAARKLEGYLDKEKVFTLEDIRLDRQADQHRIDDQRDELEQLEKMYREDELTDATEEIVLKRSRRRLAATIARAKLRTQQSDYALAGPEAIKQESLVLEAEQKAAALDRQRRTAATARAKRDAELQRSTFELARQERTLIQLRRDRERLTVRAPRGGLVLHGDVESTPGTATLERGDRAAMFKTVMTVADPDRLVVVAEVPEPSLPEARDGTAATVTVAAAPGFEAVGALQVGYLPATRAGDENIYRARIELDARDTRLRPGMRCTVSIEREEPREDSRGLAAKDRGEGS